MKVIPVEIGETVYGKELHPSSFWPVLQACWSKWHIEEISNKCGCADQLKPVDLDLNDGKRLVGDIVLFLENKGKCLIWDLTGSDTFAT